MDNSTCYTRLKLRDPIINVSFVLANGDRVQCPSDTVGIELAIVGEPIPQDVIDSVQGVCGEFTELALSTIHKLTILAALKQSIE